MSDDEVVISARGVEQSARARLRRSLPLIVTWAGRDLRTRYRQSLLRSGWSFVQPLTVLVIYGWVLTSVLDVSSGDVPYLTFAWAGIVPFTFFSSALGQGVGSVQQAGPVISRVYFPRDVLPLSVVLAGSVDLGIMLVTLVVVAWVQVGPPSVYLLGLLPVLAVLYLWTAAVTVAASAVTVYRRDLNFAVPLALRVLFIVTPIMYPAELVARTAPWLNTVNPLAVVVEGVRSAIYGERWPSGTPLTAQAIVGLVALVLALALFRRLEPRMSDFV
ncbi:MAG: ABC transporter permease [Microthrixaceae bacterium]